MLVVALCAYCFCRSLLLQRHLLPSCAGPFGMVRYIFHWIDVKRHGLCVVPLCLVIRKGFGTLPPLWKSPAACEI